MAPVVDLKRTADNTEGPLKFNMQTGRVSRPYSSGIFVGVLRGHNSSPFPLEFRCFFPQF